MTKKLRPKSNPMARTNLTPVGLRHLLRHRHMEEPPAMSVDDPLEAISPTVWRISQMTYQDLRVIVQAFVELTDWCLTSRAWTKALQERPRSGDSNSTRGA